MKQLIAMLVALLVIAPAAAPAAPLDAERVAQFFGSLKLDRCIGEFRFSRFDGERFVEDVRAVFAATPDLRAINYLEIQGMVVVDTTNGDDPLRGIPKNAKGQARGFNLWTWCYEGETLRTTGYAYADLLGTDDTIVVYVYPANAPIVIPVKLPKGVDPGSAQLITDTQGLQNSWRYLEEFGGFLAWLDPLFVSEYSVWSGDGVLVTQGSVDPLTKQVSPSTEQALNRVLPAGVVEVAFVNSQFRYEDDALNGVVVRGDQLVPAQVFYADLGEAGAQVEVWGGLTGVTVEVRSLADMAVIASGEGQVAVPNRSGRIAVTVLGKPSPFRQTYSVNIWRGWFGGGGGGNEG